jgi:hypothetical protein
VVLHCPPFFGERNGQICELDMLNVLKDIDLRAFYAIGVAFLGEGIGSMCSSDDFLGMLCLVLSL